MRPMPQGNKIVRYKGKFCEIYRDIKDYQAFDCGYFNALDYLGGRCAGLHLQSAMGIIHLRIQYTVKTGCIGLVCIGILPISE
jgi:hypothetical protein